MLSFKAVIVQFHYMQHFAEDMTVFRVRSECVQNKYLNYQKYKRIGTKSLNLVLEQEGEEKEKKKKKTKFLSWLGSTKRKFSRMKRFSLLYDKHRRTGASISGGGQPICPIFLRFKQPF